MQEILDSFVFSLVGDQTKSRNTILSYKRDISHYLEFLKSREIQDISKTNRATVLTYLLLLQKQGSYGIKTPSIVAFFLWIYD